MLNLDGLNMNQNRKVRTRIAVVATDENGDKKYFRSVGVAANAFKLSAARIKACAITHMPINGYTLELVPASTIEEFLPEKSMSRYGNEPRERGILAGITFPPKVYAQLKELSLKRGVKYTKLVREAVTDFLKKHGMDEDG